MRYETATTMTPREVLQQALATFGPGGLGLQVVSQQNLALVFQGGGGYVAITAHPGAKTTLELETREWDHAVRQFMAQVHRRQFWLLRYWRKWRQRTPPTDSAASSFNILDP